MDYSDSSGSTSNDELNSVEDYTSNEFTSDNSMDIADEVDENFNRTIENCIKRLLVIFEQPKDSAELEEFYDDIIQLMSWFYETKWLWDSSDTLTTLDVHIPPDVLTEDILNDGESLQESFANLLKNNYGIQIKEIVNNYFEQNPSEL